MFSFVLLLAKLYFVLTYLRLVFRFVNAGFYIYFIYASATLLGAFTIDQLFISLKQLALMNLTVSAVYFLTASQLEYCKQKRVRSTFLALVFTTSLTSSAFYWILYVYNPNYLSFSSVDFSSWVTYAVHIWPPLATLVDTLLFPPVEPFYAFTALVLNVAYCGYVTFIEVATNNGDFIYPMFEQLAVSQRCLVYLCGLGVLVACFLIVLIVIMTVYQLASHLTDYAKSYKNKNSVNNVDKVCQHNTHTADYINETGKIH